MTSMRNGLISGKEEIISLAPKINYYNIESSAFFKDSPVVGQNCQRAIFLAQDICDRRRCDPSTAGTS
jgi:hypothetical protein